jgi:hypothetical protein
MRYVNIPWECIGEDYKHLAISNGSGFDNEIKWWCWITKSLRPEMPLLNAVQSFKLKMHIGTEATPSKTEAMFFPPPRRLYSLMQIPWGSTFSNIWGILFASSILRGKFKYPGSIVHHFRPQMQTLISALCRYRPLLRLLKIFWLTKKSLSKSKEEST